MDFVELDLVRRVTYEVCERRGIAIDQEGYASSADRPDDRNVVEDTFDLTTMPLFAPEDEPFAPAVFSAAFEDAEGICFVTTSRVHKLLANRISRAPADEIVALLAQAKGWQEEVFRSPR